MRKKNDQSTGDCGPIVCTIPTSPKEVSTLTKSVHSMPIQINYSGPAKVTTYFTPEPKSKYVSALLDSEISPPAKEVTTDGVQFYSASFRGREVTGRIVNLTENNCVGIIIEDGAVEAPTAQFQVRKIGVKRTAPAVAEEAKEAPKLKPNTTITTAFPELYVWNKDNQQITHDYITRSVEHYCVLADALHGE